MKKLSAREQKVANATLGGLAFAGLTAWALDLSSFAILGLAFCGFMLGGFLAETFLKKALPTSSCAEPDALSLRPDTANDAAKPLSGSPLPQPRSDVMGILDRQVAEAAQIANDEATIGSLYRFRKLWERLSEAVLDDDLAQEVAVITSQNFPRLVSVYRSSIELADEHSTRNADKVLKASVDRLIARLDEIASVQMNRSLDGLTTTDNYLRKRRPIADDDPF